MTGSTAATRTGIDPDGVRRFRRAPEPPQPPQIPGDSAFPAEPPAANQERDDLLAAAVRKVLKDTDAYSGLVYLRSRDRRSLVLSTVAGVPVSALGAFRRVSVHSPLPAPMAYRTGRSVCLSGTEETLRRFPQLLVGLPYSFASVCAPIVSGPETYGVLCGLWTPSSTGLPTSARRHLRATANRLGGQLAELAARGDRVEGAGDTAVVELPTAPGTAIRLGLFDWNLATGTVSVDEELGAILGWTPEQFDGRAETVAARLHPDDLPGFCSAARGALTEGRVLAMRLRVTAGDNRSRSVEVRARASEAAAGRSPDHLVGTVLDTGTGVAAAEAVERLRQGIFSLDPDGRITYANLGAELLLGAHREEMLGRHLWDCLGWLSDPAYEDRHRSAMISRQSTAYLACRPPDRWLSFAFYPDAHGVTGTVIPAAGPPKRHGRGHATPSRTTLPATTTPPATTPPATTPPPPATSPSATPPVAFEPPTPARRAGVGAIYRLLQLASTLTQAVTVHEVCTAVAEQILPAFGGQELAIYVVAGNRLDLAHQVGYPEAFLDRFEGTPMGARLPGVEALSTGAPIFFSSVDELARAYPGIPLDEMCAWAFLPLIASGHPVGSCILGFDEPHPFTSEERGVLTALGGLIAQALERARLYDTEFALARGLQNALLPHRLPKVPGVSIAARYLPGTQSMEIGGDWYDAIVTAQGLCLVIGDVEGHSVAAAATMGQLRSAVRAFATSGCEPNEVLVRTNRLLADLDPDLLASCCLIQLDRTAGLARIARAGHLPPLLRHADGHTDVLECPGGALLGVDPLTEYPISELRPPPGSVLALYTDGLVEEPGTSIDEGIDRLRVSLAHADASSLEELADRLLSDARRSTHRADDVALLLTAFDAEQ
ncbi:SpoIIE family protein phosphatase [Streptomyces sp. H39-S7]|uniref:SpoIIE family protein phosphatase n=1 Tax=Streptomyces sp. H39-S7 TaxID=3004357 RepID=UPI0022AED3F7|nr:SpoIIE family protein phosphatase [Streptomyces sp. H39-S7]MCZ4123524.1 SpoIIE family protein phosphatase [Streptomyces sp. H39-S7]